MSHLDYYKFQNQARGVRTLADIQEDAKAKAYLYDRIVLPWLYGRKRIAELACGHGTFLQYLKSRHFQEIVGIDSSPEQISLARQIGVKIEEEEVNTWLSRQSRESFDALIAIDLIEHLSKDAFMDLLKTANNLLTTGGRLVLRYPNGDSPLVGRNLFNDITHVWTYTPNCLDSLARMNGYSTVHFTDESTAAIRDHRWLKVPLSRLSTSLMKFLFQAVTRERVQYWSPHLWACLVK